MFLAVDIGNTNIVIGIFKGKRIIKSIRFYTYLKYPEMLGVLKQNIKPIERIETVLISSVVPPAAKVIISMFKNHFNIKPLVLGKDIIVPIKNLYKKPKQVGQDRLVNAYACLKLYGKPAIIVDFGTATTFDYLDKNGTYQGGLITPGIGISLQALAENTALLPKIKLKKPKGLIGKDTVESIRSGIFYSMAAVCDGIIEKIKDKYGSKVKVVATGGLSNFFSPYCKYIDIIDKDLTLKGIHLISTKGTLSCLGWRQFPD